MDHEDTRVVSHNFLQESIELLKKKRRRCTVPLSHVSSRIALPETGELGGRALWLALLPDHHLIEEPAAASPAAVMADTNSANLAQRHGLDEKLIVLRERRGGIGLKDVCCAFQRQFE